MQEYFLYVVIIYLPIAWLIYHLLNKEGLTRREIVIVLTISLFIILSFPISVSKLGTTFSLFMYGILLVLLGGYFIKATSCSVAQAPSKALVPKKLPDPNREDIHHLQEGEQVELSNSEPTFCTIELQDASKLMAADQLEQPAAQEIPDHPVLVTVEETNKLSQEEELDRESQFEIAAEIEITAIAVTEEEEPIQPDENGAVTVNIGSAPALTDQNEILSPVENQAALDLNKTFPGHDHDLEIEVDNDENNKGKDKDDTSRSDETTVTNLIDKAFDYKATGEMDLAITWFEKAFNVSRDEELKALIALEINTYFKAEGNYYRAEDIMERCVGFNNLEPDIINEVKSQLLYTRILHQELVRLGMENCPLANVPRMVRMKVAEEHALLAKGRE